MKTGVRNSVMTMVPIAAALFLVADAANGTIEPDHVGVVLILVFFAMAIDRIIERVCRQDILRIRCRQEGEHFIAWQSNRRPSADLIFGEQPVFIGALCTATHAMAGTEREAIQLVARAAQAKLGRRFSRYQIFLCRKISGEEKGWQEAVYPLDILNAGRR